jgi:hypothetical protein
VIAATVAHATIEELLETVFSVRSAPRLLTIELELGQKYGHGSRWGSTPRIIKLANASSKLLLACLLEPVKRASLVLAVRRDGRQSART